MNPVLILTRNCLELTKRCIESIRNQDISTTLFVIDNGSSDGTSDWLMPRRIGFDTLVCMEDNCGVSSPWNFGLKFLFTQDHADHVLVVNNDTFFPPWFYRELLSYDVPFLTGVSVDNMDAIKEPAPRLVLQPAPDFSAFLIRRECWERIGTFDEGMKFYAQDADYHIRAVRLGIPLLKANLPFYHERSSTLKQAPPEERRAIQLQADDDRRYFQGKYGFTVGSPEHYKAVGFEYSPAPPKVLFPGVHGNSA